MPLIGWSKNLFQDRIDFEGSLSTVDIQALIEDQELKVLQCSTPVESQTWNLLNEQFFPLRPEVELRAYSFYTLPCDLSFASKMTNVQHFSADCLLEAVGVEHVAAMTNLKTLHIGIYKLESFDFLNQVNPNLKRLILGATRSKKPDLSPLSRFASLEEIYLEGQQKNIEVLSQLRNLKDVTLRSINTLDLRYLRPLQKMWSLDIKLGGIRNLNDIEGMETIKYLELWQIRELTDIGVISSLRGLQYFFLQSLRRISALPPLQQLKNLRRVSLDNLKDLRDFSSLEFAPALVEFVHTRPQPFKPEDYLPLFRNPNLKSANVWYSSSKLNQRFDTLLADHKLAPKHPLQPFEFI